MLPSVHIPFGDLGVPLAGFTRVLDSEGAGKPRLAGARRWDRMTATEERPGQNPSRLSGYSARVMTLATLMARVVWSPATFAVYGSCAPKSLMLMNRSSTA